MNFLFHQQASDVEIKPSTTSSIFPLLFFLHRYHLPLDVTVSCRQMWLFVHLFTLHFACLLHVPLKQMWEVSARARTHTEAHAHTHSRPAVGMFGRYARCPPGCRQWWKPDDANGDSITAVNLSEACVCVRFTQRASAWRALRWLVRQPSRALGFELAFCQCSCQKEAGNPECVCSCIPAARSLLGLIIVTNPKTWELRSPFPFLASLSGSFRVW